RVERVVRIGGARAEEVVHLLPDLPVLARLVQLEADAADGDDVVLRPVAQPRNVDRAIERHDRPVRELDALVRPRVAAAGDPCRPSGSHASHTSVAGGGIPLTSRLQCRPSGCNPSVYASNASSTTPLGKSAGSSGCGGSNPSRKAHARSGSGPSGWNHCPGAAF